jgi:hypothetical protein
MEAKLAWYGPAGGSGRDIVAAKALPADLPVVVRRGVPAPGPIHAQTVFMLAAFAAAFLYKADALRGRNTVYARLSVSSAAYFSPSLFFRPPPVR